MKNVKNINLILLFCLLNLFAFSADNSIKINGTVYEVPDLMSDCNIVVHKNGIASVYAKSKEDGTFNLSLELGYKYMIEFSQGGYVTKKISVDTKTNTQGISEDKSVNELVIDLFQAVPGENYDILDNPIAKIVFDAEKGDFVYDMDYNEKIQAKVQDLWNTVYESRNIRNKNFNKHMKLADKKFDNEEYVNAKVGYIEALLDRPMAKKPKEKIKVIDGILNAQENNEIASFDAIEISSNGIQEETYESGNKIILKRYVQDENRSTKYHKVSHKYNESEYYFRNNTPITKVIWELETELTEN